MTLGALVHGERSVTIAKPLLPRHDPVDGWVWRPTIGEPRLPIG